MSEFTKERLINIFSGLGVQLINPDGPFLSIINEEKHYNAWFTAESVLYAITAIGKILTKNKLETWLDNYKLNESHAIKRVGLIMAGNIPLVGFHDVLCILITGNYALIKAPGQNTRLIKYVLGLLTNIEPEFKGRFSFVERLANFDVVIATGSNNSSRYFEYYFSKVPHIIRKNRSSAALLTGDETEKQLHELGHDIFDYFGLGCRNVSKIYVPGGYNFNFFFESIETYQPVINHHKYNNNYDYNKSIFLVNSDKHLDNGFLLLKEDTRLASPLAVLYFEYYDDLQLAQAKLNGDSERIQCVLSSVPIEIKNQVVDFGKSQQPALWDYADGVDTMAFLTELKC